jgi:hypothetical protein
MVEIAPIYWMAAHKNVRRIFKFSAHCNCFTSEKCRKADELSFRHFSYLLLDTRGFAILKRINRLIAPKAGLAARSTTGLLAGRVQALMETS